MTQDELVKEMAAQLKQNLTIKEIQEAAASKGFSPEQTRVALDDAHTLAQQQAEKDITIRVLLGPVLLAIAFVAFYADWAGRSVGPGTFIGVIALLIGGRLCWSLIKQLLRKNKPKLR